MKEGHYGTMILWYCEILPLLCYDSVKHDTLIVCDYETMSENDTIFGLVLRFVFDQHLYFLSSSFFSSCVCKKNPSLRFLKSDLLFEICICLFIPLLVVPYFLFPSFQTF